MFVSTRLLSPVAYSGLTGADKDSYEYRDFWNEERRRCLEGYSAGGTTITGLHYYYLNHWKIRAKGRKDMAEAGTQRKGLFYPRFLDIDYDFFWEVERARKAGEDLLLLKRRQIGASFKIGCIAAYEFEFFPHSQTIITSGEEKFWKKTFRDARYGLDLHAGTAFYKARHLHDSTSHIQASFFVDVDGRKELRGYMGDMRGITATDPQALVSNSPSLVIYEEIGMFKGIIETKGYTDAAMMTEGVKTGMSILVGTGGEENMSIADVGKMMLDPEMYGCRGFDNVWEEFEAVDDAKKTKRKVGMFIPGYKYYFIDEDGNSDVEKSRRELQRRRDNLKRDPKAQLGLITQFPFNIGEALMRPDGNQFPVELLRQQLHRVKAYEDNRDRVRCGELEWEYDKGFDTKIIGVRWIDRPDGHFRVTHFPEIDPSTGKVYKGLYCAGTDSYDRDKVATTTTGSFGSCYIGQAFIPDLSKPSFIPKCASYTHRPETGADFYEASAKLCVFYGWCLNLVEYSNLRLFDWYDHHGLGHLLAERPDVVYQNMVNSTVQNRRGLDTQAQVYAISYLGDLLVNGGTLKMWDEQDIEELISYRPEMNSDRVIAMAHVAVQLKQMEWAVMHRQNKLAKPRMPGFSFPGYAMQNGELVALDLMG